MLGWRKRQPVPEVSPGATPHQVYLAALAALSGRGRRGRQEHRQLLEIAAGRGHAIALYDLGRVAIREGDTTRARELLTRSVQLGYRLAEGELGQLDRAGRAEPVPRPLPEGEDAWLALHRDGDDAATMELGLLAWERGDLGEAERWFRIAVDDDSEHTRDADIHLGRLLFRTGRGVEAEPLVREAEQHVGALELAWLLEGQGDDETAQAIYESLWDDAGEPAAVAGLARIAARSGDEDAAREWRDTARTLNAAPDLPDFARPPYSDSGAAAPPDDVVWAGARPDASPGDRAEYARHLERNRRWDEAVPIWQALAEHQYSAVYSLGVAQAAAGRTAEAVITLRVAMREPRNRPYAAHEYGELLVAGAEDPDQEEGEALLRKSQHWGAFYLAWLLERRGALDEAEAIYDDIVHGRLRKIDWHRRGPDDARAGLARIAALRA